MKNLSIKELVNRALNGRKLKNSEWDFISINWRDVSTEKFLNRFCPFLRWDIILNNIKTEEEYEKIYKIIFKSEEPDEEIREYDISHQGYPRKKWEVNFLPFSIDKDGNILTDKPRKKYIYYYARSIIRKLYCKKEIPNTILSKIINDDIVFENSDNDIIALSLAGTGKLKDVDTFFTFIEKCIESLAYIKSDLSIGNFIMHNHNKDVIEGYIKESINKICEPYAWLAIFGDEISKEIEILLRKRACELE